MSIDCIVVFACVDNVHVVQVRHCLSVHCRPIRGLRHQAQQHSRPELIQFLLSFSTWPTNGCWLVSDSSC